MSLEEMTYKRRLRILLLHDFAKAKGTTDFDTITDKAVIKFGVSRKTAESYAKEVLLRLELENPGNLGEENV